MKVELSIKDDKDLRNLIKDMIRGCVKAIAREEVQELVRTELLRKIEARYNERVVDNLYKEYAKDVVKSVLGTRYDEKSKVRNEAEKLLNAEVEKFKKFLEKQEELIKTKLKKFLASKGIDIGDLL